MVAVAYWWLAFGLSHMVGCSKPVRYVLISHLGVLGFRLVYSCAAVFTFVSLCRAFSLAQGQGPVFYQPAPVLHGLALFLTVIAFFLLFQGLATPTPLSLLSEMSEGVVDEARGVYRLTRHPVNWAFMFFGLGHLMVNPAGVDVTFWGGFIVFGAVSALHQDQRLLAEGRAGFGPFYLQTSLIPFAAIVQGRQRLNWHEFNGGALGIALLAVAVLGWFHGPLFGGFGGEPLFSF